MLEVWKWVLSNCPLSKDSNILVMIYIYSHKAEASLCGRATATAVTKITQERIFPAEKIPPEAHRNRGTNFTSQILYKVRKIWLILQHFHCTYSQSSGFVKQTSETDKIQMVKLVESFNLPWPKALFPWYCLTWDLFPLVNINCPLTKSLSKTLEDYIEECTNLP